MQDVLPPHEKSIRQIPVPAGRKRMSAYDVPEQKLGRERGPRKTSLILWIAAGIVVCTLVGLLLAALFEGASITVTPRAQSVILNDTLTASPNAPTDSLAYETLSLDRQTSRDIPARGTTQVERRASGGITIYNAYGKEPQKLIKNTRFETQDGKIYRINESVTVPGATTLADKSIRPGEITVTVYADSAGEEYNHGATTFTIPGFKGDPRFDKFSAKSTTAITGGYIGEEKIVADADLSEALASMHTELTQSLNEALVAELPVGYILLPSTIALAFTESPREQGGGETAKVILMGHAKAAMVREKDLAGEIAKKHVEGYAGEALLFRDKNALSVTTPPVAILGDDALTLTLSGEPVLVWQFDSESLKVALAGKDRAAFETAIATFKPAIARAEASIRPFFKSAFPSDPEDIEVYVEEN